MDLITCFFKTKEKVSFMLGNTNKILSISERAVAAIQQPKNKFLTDVDVCKYILEASRSRDYDNMNWDFFYTNKSGMSLEDVQLFFMTHFPSVQSGQAVPQILCGANDNREQRPIERGVFRRKINLKAIPWGRNPDTRANDRTVSKGFWNIDYPLLPSFMAFDVDANSKPDFRKLFPNSLCHQIHEEFDIARPLVTTINPISRNCQFLYGMRWTSEDHANADQVYMEFEGIRAELSRLLGADPQFRNHVVRSPMYIEGWHKNEPWRSSSTKLFNPEKEALWHYSIWYQPHLYTLSELKELIISLKTLHEKSGRRLIATNYSQHIIPTQKREDIIVPKTKQSIPDVFHKGERNCSMFDLMRHYAYPQAYKFKDAGSFAEHLYEKFSKVNIKRCAPSLPSSEIQATARSVANYCIMKGFKKPSWTDEDRAYASLIKFGPNHVTNKTKVADKNFSLRTFYRYKAHARKRKFLITSKTYTGFKNVISSIPRTCIVHLFHCHFFVKSNHDVAKLLPYSSLSLIIDNDKQLLHLKMTHEAKIHKSTGPP